VFESLQGTKTGNLKKHVEISKLKMIAKEKVSEPKAFYWAVNENNKLFITEISNAEIARH
jgi:hypothetical protein